jgi:hypothetical protein
MPSINEAIEARKRAAIERKAQRHRVRTVLAVRRTHGLRRRHAAKLTRAREKAEQKTDITTGQSDAENQDRFSGAQLDDAAVQRISLRSHLMSRDMPDLGKRDVTGDVT